jgi:hypothetical protein
MRSRLDVFRALRRSLGATTVFVRETTKTSARSSDPWSMPYRRCRMKERLTESWNCQTPARQLSQAARNQCCCSDTSRLAEQRLDLSQTDQNFRVRHPRMQSGVLSTWSARRDREMETRGKRHMKLRVGMDHCCPHIELGRSTGREHLSGLRTVADNCLSLGTSSWKLPDSNF